MHIGIIGQGLAGTLAAFRLQQAGMQVSVIDPGTENSSAIASGLINPVTGRNYVKSWQIEHLLQLSDAWYPQMEAALSIHCYHPIRLYRILQDHLQVEKWMQRAIMPGYESFLTPDPIRWDPMNSGLSVQVEVGEVREARWLDTAKLLKAFRDRWIEAGNYHQAVWNSDETKFMPDGVKWRDINFDYLLFAEGSGVAANPYFNWLPIKPSKGERLLIEANSGLKQSIKANYFIVPYREENHFWIGSPTDFSATDPLPSASGRDVLDHHVRTWLTEHYSVLDHAAAYRPASRDRRPVIGFHPGHPRLGILNGLGTKGVSLAPYLADLMVTYFKDHIPFPKEVDISRFSYPDQADSR